MTEINRSQPIHKIKEKVYFDYNSDRDIYVVKGESGRVYFEYTQPEEAEDKATRINRLNNFY
jgi:hypothetical protein